MAGKTPNRGYDFPNGTDGPAASQIETLAREIDSDAVLKVATFSALPAPGTDGRLADVADTDKVYRDNGTAWKLVNASTIRTVPAFITLGSGQNQNANTIPFGITYATPPNVQATMTSGAGGVGIALDPNPSTTGVLVTIRRSDGTNQGAPTNYSFKLLVTDAELG